MSQSLADQLAATALSGGNAGFIEDLYEKFLQDPSSVDPAWAKYFGELKGTSTREVDHGEFRERLLTRQERLPSAPPVPPATPAPSAAGDVASAKQGAVSRLIQVYANRGHLIANLDPLGIQERAQPYVLNLEYFGLSDADLETEFFTNSRNATIPGRSKLKNILSTLKFIYNK
jgi:2-oxoglutarate dehydrogenase E1 component